MPHNTPEKRAAYLAATKERREAREQVYRDANKQRISDRDRAARAADPEKARAKERADYAANAEQERARDRAWYQANAEKMRAKSRAYGRSPARDQPLYSVWTGMKTRCLNPKNKDYANYGGRGIGICPRWRDSYAAFEADMLPTYLPGLTLERIDNASDYAPENCRWATRGEQNRNWRHNVYVDTPWGHMLLVDAAAKSGINPITMYWRHRHGRDLFKPVQQGPGRTP